MLNRVILAIIFLASLSWIVYVGLDLASEKNNYSPESLFNKQDGKILVVIRPDEVNFNSVIEFGDSPCLDIMKSLNDSIYNLGYFSEKRAHLLLVKNDNWNNNSVKSVFNNASVTITGSETFTLGKYKGRFHKSKLYLQKGEINNENTEESTFVFDKKASAAILRFGDKAEINNYSDIYFKDDGQIKYITRDENIQQGSQVRDELLFAGIVTKNFESYHFFERDYYASIDEDFKTGPMSKWILNGFVKLKYNGQTVFVSDYIGGQDPILILNDLNQTQDSSRFTNRLTADFPSENNSFTIKYLEDAVVISESAETCEHLIADYKLGKTIALDEKTRAKVFGNLPRSVSERLVEKEESYSKAIYKGRLMETHTGPAALDLDSKPSIASSATMTCGFDIKDFYVFPGEGNVAVLGKKGEFIRFKNKKSNWKKDLKAKTLGDIQIIDLHGTDEEFILLNTADEIHLWDDNGKYQTGFPIKLGAEVTNEVKFYRWKGNSYFLIADINNKVLHFDAKGRELNMFSSEMEVTRQIDVWASQKRLFIGFANNKDFKMYDMKKKRIHREFPINSNAYPIKVPNQLFQFSMVNNHLVKFDQKGIKFEFDNYKDAKILGIQPDKSNPVIILQTMNEIHLINSEGISFSHITLPFNEVEDVHINTSESGKTFIALIDGLENNVYLYGTDGQLVVKKSLEGQSKIRLSTLNNQKQITTIVDQFVTQYLED